MQGACLSARSHSQGWPQATRKGIGLDRGEDDATITNRGHTHHEMIFNQQPENATMSQDTCQRCPETSHCGPRGVQVHDIGDM